MTVTIPLLCQPSRSRIHLRLSFLVVDVVVIVVDVIVVVVGAETVLQVVAGGGWAVPEQPQRAHDGAAVTEHGLVEEDVNERPRGAASPRRSIVPAALVVRELHRLDLAQVVGVVLHQSLLALLRLAANTEVTQRRTTNEDDTRNSATGGNIWIYVVSPSDPITVI